MSYDYRYNKLWRLERARGIARYIDPKPTRQHIQQLLASGASQRAIAEAAGVSPSGISQLIRLEGKFVTRGMATRILAVRPEQIHQRSAPRGFVPGIGTRRRIQALQAIGHTAAAVGAAGGVTAAVIHNLTNQAGDWVTAANRDAVLRAYSALWSTPGASAKTKSHALRKGWVPPLAWDDDTIDDPTSQPHMPVGRAVNTGRPAEDIAEDVEWFLEDEPLATSRRVSDRLGVSANSIQIALKRAHRADLLDQLARNADLARPGQANRKDTAA